MMARRLLLAAAVAAAVPSAAAQAPVAPAAAPSVPAAPAIDRQRLALATVVVDKVFPVGTYKRLMGGTMDRMLGSIVDTAGALPMRQLAAIGGMDEAEASKLPQASLAQVMEIYDPHYRERTRIGMRAMMDAMSVTMTRLEPRVRSGLARAYARKFDLGQLRDLDAFFRTATGSYYAAESMGIYMDPELMAEMQAFAPELLKDLPAMAKTAEAATAALPKPRRMADLSPAERKRLAALLRVEDDALSDPPATSLPNGTTP